MRLLLLIVLACCIQTAAGQTTLQAEDDFFDTNTDVPLVIGGAGLLENDSLVVDSLYITLVSEPMNGEVVINYDGSFTYTPNPLFNGIDAFTYRLETLPLQALEIDTLQSVLNFDMGVDLPIIGSDDDNAEGRMGGMTYLYLNEGTAQLYDMNLQMIDPLSLSFRFGGLITVGRLFVDAEPGAFMLNLSRRSDPSNIIDGLFSQDSAKVQVMGTVLLDGTGLIDGQVPEDPEEFDTETSAMVDVQLLLTDSTVTAEVPIDLEEAFELSGVDVDMAVEGQLVASGPLLQPIMSNEATVMITVDPISRTGIGEETPFAYSLSQNYPNPFNPTTTIHYSIEEAAYVQVHVFDLLGREVAVLVDEMQVQGRHEVVFDAADLPSGMYLYRLESGRYSETKRMVVVR